MAFDPEIHGTCSLGLETSAVESEFVAGGFMNTISNPGVIFGARINDGLPQIQKRRCSVAISIVQRARTNLMALFKSV